MVVLSYVMKKACVRVWGPNPWNPPLMVLRLKLPNRPRVAYSIRVPRHSTCVTAVLDRPATKSSWASLDSHVCCLDSVNTVTLMYTCTCRCPSYLFRLPASWSLVLHRSWSISTTCPYLTFSSSSTTAFELHTCTPKVKRHVVQPNSRHG
jgi:hypothetical protein